MFNSATIKHQNMLILIFVNYMFIPIGQSVRSYTHAYTKTRREGESVKKKKSFLSVKFIKGSAVASIPS